MSKKITKGLNILEMVLLFLNTVLLLFDIIEPSRHLLIVFSFIFLMKSIARYLDI